MVETTYTVRGPVVKKVTRSINKHPSSGGSGVTADVGDHLLLEGGIGTTNLIAWWKLDEGSGLTRVDSHTNNYDLADSATVGSAAGLLGNASSTAGGTSSALSIAVGSAPLLFPADVDFCITGWVYFNSITANTGIISTYDFTDGYILWTPPASGNVLWQVRGTSITWTTPSTGAWHHFVAWHDATANEIGLRIDDSSEGTTPHATGINASGLLPFKLHQYGIGAFSFDGLLDEVGVWSAKPSAATITALYNAGAGVTYEDLAGSDALLLENGSYLILE